MSRRVAWLLVGSFLCVLALSFTLAGFRSSLIRMLSPMPDMQKAKASAIQVQCMHHMRSIGISLQAYMADNDGWLPPSLVAAAPYLPQNDDNPQCPLASSPMLYAGYIYRYEGNPVRPQVLESISEAPMLYEDSALRHNGYINVLFMDGRVNVLQQAGLAARLALPTTAPAVLPE